MDKGEYNEEYFKVYFDRGKILKKDRGDRGILYGFWMRYLKRNVPVGARVLEVGCGVGFFGRRLQEYYSYTGLDISLDALKYCREVNNIKSVVHSSTESLPFSENYYDVVIAFDVVEHLNDPSLFFSEAYRVLKLSGMLILSTPNIYSFGVKKKSGSKILVPSMFKDKTHISLLAPETWLSLLQTAGFSIVRRGTDNLWDIPYYERIPLLIQKIILIPLNVFILLVFGFLSWNQGENLIIIARK
jgi:2-polyprenyl-3-methyl-5-hydroxy-6-metoxy-1,4-benzoquinol methylase